MEMGTKRRRWGTKKGRTRSKRVAREREGIDSRRGRGSESKKRETKEEENDKRKRGEEQGRRGKGEK